MPACPNAAVFTALAPHTHPTAWVVGSMRSYPPATLPVSVVCTFVSLPWEVPSNQCVTPAVISSAGDVAVSMHGLTPSRVLLVVLDCIAYFCR